MQDLFSLVDLPSRDLDSVDDHSRVSFARVLPDEKAVSCVQFLREAVAYYAGLGVRIERVMTDNGTGYKNTFKAACDELGIGHIKTRPYTPKTNGKAERFVQTSLREWAYARPYVSSAQREAALQPFLHRYNWHRPHSALNCQPPMSRIPAMNNLLARPLPRPTSAGASCRPSPR